MSSSQEDSQRRIYWGISFLFNLIAVWFIQPLKVFYSMYAGIELPRAEAGLIEMSGTLASFSPIFGIGISIALLMIFFALASLMGAKAENV